MLAQKSTSKKKYKNKTKRSKNPPRELRLGPAFPSSPPCFFGGLLLSRHVAVSDGVQTPCSSRRVTTSPPINNNNNNNNKV